MGGNDYLIPFGIDGKEFFMGMSEIDASIDKTAENTKEANAEMQKAILSTAGAADKLNTSLNADVKTTSELRDQAKQMGAALTTAFKSGADSKEIEKRLGAFSTLFSEIQAKAKTGIKLDADASKMAAFNAAIEAGSVDLEAFNQVITYTKEQLATLDPNSEAFAELNQQLQVAEGFMEGLGISTNETETKTKSLKSQLREMKAALVEMELAGKGDTQEFKQLSIQAGELEDQIGDVSQRVRVLASDTKYLDAGVQALQGLAGGFAAAQGAAALFAGENENVQKIIQKVTGAMAILQGIQALATALNKDSALSVLLLGRAQAAQTVTTEVLTVATEGEAVATVAAETATKGFTAALLANPITAVLVALAAIIGAIIAFSSATDDAKESTDALNKSLEDQQAILDHGEKVIKRQTDLLVAQAKLQGKTESDITGIQQRALKERLFQQENAYGDFLANTYHNNALRAKADEATNKKIEEQNQKYADNIDDLYSELTVSELERQKQIQDEGTASAKKASESARAATESAKKSADERKKILDQQVKYANELRDQQAVLIDDATEREKVQAKNAAKAKIDVLKNEIILSEDAEKNRSKLIEAINISLAKQLQDIDKKAAADKVALAFKTEQILVDLQAESAQKELDQIGLDYQAKRNEIIETYKDEKDTREALLILVNQAERNALKLAKDKIAQDALQKEQERAELEVETASKFVGNLPRLEEQKQLAILQVKLNYAIKSKDLLVSQGQDENSTAVLQAQKQINDITKQIKDGVKDLKKKTGSDGIFNLQTLIFGDQGDEKNKAIGDALKTTLDQVKAITDFIVDQYQRQIDKKKEVIDADDAAIEDLESQLDKEKELKEQGFANNAYLLQAELDDKKKQRDKDLQDQQELIKKQQAIQRAQIIIDTATQASSLITAASEIFAAFAGIPFVGVPLAIAAIGLMTGAFVAAKVKAFQVVNDGQKFEKGGKIGGKSHAAGGQKYRSMDGTGGVIELEDGEQVINKNQTKKYSEILEAINEDNFNGISDDSLRAFFSDLGIHLESDMQKDTVRIMKEHDHLRSVFITQQNETPQELIAIKEDVAFLARAKKNEKERWEDDRYTYVKQGNKITKTEK